MLASPIVHHPTAWELGPLQVTGFGLAVLMAFVISQIIAQRELVRRGHDADAIPDLIFAAVVGTLVGGKIYYVAVISRDWSDILSRGGFVFWGGFIGAFTACAIVAWKRKLKFAQISDVAGICIAAGYSVGRTGCWAVGDDYGRPWNGPIATVFPEGAPPSTAANLTQMFGVEVPAGVGPMDVVAVHPTQLYETVLGFVMFAILWRMRDHRHAAGWLFGAWMVLAGVERFIIEFYRAKDDRFVGPLTAAQAIAIAITLAGIAVMVWRRNTGPGAPGIYEGGNRPASMRPAAAAAR